MVAQSTLLLTDVVRHEAKPLAGEFDDHDPRHERNARLAMKPKILFADDNHDICELVQFQLQAAGFRVSTADNGADVLRLVTTERFDVLLLDYWMPEVTGVELCRQIRTFDQSTPILICSGAVTEADKEAVTLAGAQGYLRKPFNSKDLIRALLSCLESSSNV